MGLLPLEVLQNHRDLAVRDVGMVGVGLADLADLFHLEQFYDYSKPSNPELNKTLLAQPCVPL